jgi:hypothetical protein
MVQLFYGFGITLLAYSLPTETVNLINTYEGPRDNLDVEDISETIESNLQSQLNIPIVDIGSLVFFSGNILIDMVINFFTAIPSMLTIAISSFFMFFPVDAFIATQIKLLFWVFAAIIYFIAFLSFIMSLRSGTTQGVI